MKASENPAPTADTKRLEGSPGSDGREGGRVCSARGGAASGRPGIPHGKHRELRIDSLRRALRQFGWRCQVTHYAMQLMVTDVNDRLTKMRDDAEQAARR